jgi:hypothetical protein
MQLDYRCDCDYTCRVSSSPRYVSEELAKVINLVYSWEDDSG